jgi:hypothetical protein
MRGVVWAGVVCIVAITGVAGYNVLRSQVLHGDVNARSLFTSVGDEAGAGALDESPEPRRCKRGPQPREWECDVSDTSGSSTVGYRVRVRPGSSCWDGTGGGSGRPRRISGCVHMSE